MFSWFKQSRPDYTKQLAQLLALASNREDVLGVKDVQIPTPETIHRDAARLAGYSDSADYKLFADEAWSRIIASLDKVLDDKATNETRQYHCGALKATLDLLRLSYQARSVLESLEKQQNESLPR